MFLEPYSGAKLESDYSKGKLISYRFPEFDSLLDINII